MTSFTANPNLITELACSAEIEEARKHAAEKVAQTAQQIAPVGDAGLPDPHPGQFKASIRAEGTQVVSDDPNAIFIIFGTSRTPPHDTLRRAAEMEGLHVMKES